MPPAPAGVTRVPAERDNDLACRNRALLPSTGCFLPALRPLRETLRHLIATDTEGKPHQPGPCSVTELQTDVLRTS